MANNNMNVFTFDVFQRRIRIAVFLRSREQNQTLPHNPLPVSIAAQLQLWVLNQGHQNFSWIFYNPNWPMFFFPLGLEVGAAILVQNLPHPGPGNEEEEEVD